MQEIRDNRTLGDLFSELSSETSTLMRQELNLAKTEMSEKARRAAKNGAYLALGAVIGFAAFLGLMALVIVLLAYVMPWWLAVLIVTAAAGVAAYLLAQKGIDRLKRLDPAPRQTIDTLKEDVQWARRQF